MWERASLVFIRAESRVGRDPGGMRQTLRRVPETECPLSLCEESIADHADGFIDEPEQTDGINLSVCTICIELRQHTAPGHRFFR